MNTINATIQSTQRMPASASLLLVQGDEPAHAPAAQSLRHFEPELFAELRSAWKSAAHAKAIDAASIAAWAIIRGADPKKGFTPITNPNKLANGSEPWAAYSGAISCCGRKGSSALAPWAALLAKQGATCNGWQWSGSHPLLALLSQAKA